MLQFQIPKRKNPRIGKLLEFMYGVVRYILHPISSFATMGISFLISTFSQATKNSEAPSWIRWCFDNHTYIFLGFGFWIILSVVFTYSDKKHSQSDAEIQKLEEIVKQKDSQLDTTTGIILNKHSEFSDFMKLRMFNDVLRDFVDSNCELDGCQLFRFSLRHADNQVTIKVQFETGYCYENVDLNCMFQNYYVINYKEYIESLEIIELWKEANTLVNHARRIVEEKLSEKAIDLFKRIQETLNSITRTDQITNERFSQYRLLYVLSVIMGSGYGRSIIRILKQEKRLVEDYLLNEKRTGILGCILLNDIFIFSHTGKSNKRGRLYVCFPFTLHQVEYIALCALSKRDLKDNSEINIDANDLQEAFFSRLETRVGN